MNNNASLCGTFLFSHFIPEGILQAHCCWVCRTPVLEDTSDVQSNASGSTQMPDSPKSGLDNAM